MSLRLGGLLTLLVLLVLSFIFAMFQGGFVSWFLFFSLFVLTVLTCLWSYNWFKGLQVERTVSTKQAVAGDTLKVTVTLNNAKPWIPYAYLWMEERLEDKRMIKKTPSLLVFPWFKRKLVLDYELDKLPRGVLQFRELTLVTGDPFGFVQKRRTFPVEEQILVYPQYKEIASWSWEKGEQLGRLRSKQPWQEQAFASGIRNYIPGDRLSHIHWKASARFQSLKTKEFEQSQSTDFIFFLDREAGAYPADDELLFELGVSLTASLVHYTLTRAAASRLISHGKQGFEELSLSQRHLSFARVLEHLAYVQADSSLPFSKVLLERSGYFFRGATLVIISPQLTKELILLLTELAHRQINLQFFWLKGKRSVPSEEPLLTMLQKADLSFYIIEDDRFEETISRGGGMRHAVPTG